ncbi:hypothetical protein D3C83_131300 [compost metagenome]
MAGKLEECLQRRVRRRVADIGAIGVLAGPAEHVEMAVAGQRRRLENRHAFFFVGQDALLG